MFDKLYFGTAGIPLSSNHMNLENGFCRLNELNLDSMELEFVRQIYISEKNTDSVKRFAKENNIILTCHGQYFINLNSKEVEKVEASKNRIYNAAKIAFLCGAKSLTFHAGFYMKDDPETTFQNIKKNIKCVLDKLKKNNVDIVIRPETTGKNSQFGSLNELIRLSKELMREGYKILPCVDFAHLHAREGKNNCRGEFIDVLNLLKKELNCLDNMHIHLAGINYGDKGEKNHLCLEDSDLDWKSLIKVLKEFDVRGVITCESPNLEFDAIMMKKYYNDLK